MIGVYAFTLWGGGGEPATLEVATRVSQEFVQAIHDQQIETAHAMLSEKFSPQITVEQFSKLVQQGEKIFSTYKKTVGGELLLISASAFLLNFEVAY